MDGLVKQKKKVSIEELLSFKPIEERVYRHRCVEAWSMVIPWAGYSLSELIKWAEPLPKAKYVQFLSLEAPDADARPGVLVDEDGLGFGHLDEDADRVGARDQHDFVLQRC